MRERIFHTLDPVYTSDSKILILGTMPSPASRAAGFYYGHPRNRFFRVLSDLFGEPLPEGREARTAFLLRHHIALWDVLKSCTIDGADDSSIREPVPNDFSGLLKKTDIQAVFTTGRKAGELYRRYAVPATGIPAHLLPSTSPANARISYEDLLAAYKVILTCI